MDFRIDLLPTAQVHQGQVIERSIIALKDGEALFWWIRNEDEKKEKAAIVVGQKYVVEALPALISVTVEKGINKRGLNPGENCQVEKIDAHGAKVVFTDGYVISMTSFPLHTQLKRL